MIVVTDPLVSAVSVRSDSFRRIPHDLPARPSNSLAELHVGQHALLQSCRSSLSRADNRSVQARLSNIAQLEGLSIEGDAHNQFRPLGSTRYPVLERKCCVLSFVLVLWSHVERRDVACLAFLGRVKVVRHDVDEVEVPRERGDVVGPVDDTSSGSHGGG